MIKKLIQCEECEASFVIHHDLEERYYKISFCPFCSEEIELQDQYGEDEEDEWE